MTSGPQKCVAADDRVCADDARFGRTRPNRTGTNLIEWATRLGYVDAVRMRHASVTSSVRRATSTAASRTITSGRSL